MIVEKGPPPSPLFGGPPAHTSDMGPPMHGVIRGDLKCKCQSSSSLVEMPYP